MRRAKSILVASALWVVFGAWVVPALADVPRCINYQGRVRGASNNPVGLKLEFFNADANGTSLFLDRHEDFSGSGGSDLRVALTHGVFSVRIGTGRDIDGAPHDDGVPDAVLAASEVWLEVTIIDGATSTTLSPRTQLVMVPFAGRAAVAEQAEQLARAGSDPVVTIEENSVDIALSGVGDAVNIHNSNGGALVKASGTGTTNLCT